MSENNQQNEILKNQLKKEDNTRAESLKGLKDDAKNRNETFNISVSDLEQLMGFYKERQKKIILQITNQKKIQKINQKKTQIK